MYWIQINSYRLMQKYWCWIFLKTSISFCTWINKPSTVKINNPIDCKTEFFFHISSFLDVSTDGRYCFMLWKSSERLSKFLSAAEKMHYPRIHNESIIILIFLSYKKKDLQNCEHPFYFFIIRRIGSKSFWLLGCMYISKFIKKCWSNG